MTKDQAQGVLDLRDQAFQCQDRMLELAGLTRRPMYSQWVTPDGDFLWRDEALRWAEVSALVELGQHPNQGRF